MLVLIDLWFYGMIVGFIAALTFQAITLLRLYTNFWPGMRSTTDLFLGRLLCVISFGGAALSLFAYLALMLGDPQ